MALAQDNTATQVQQWLNLLSGSQTTDTTSPSTETTQGNLTTDQMSSIVQSILGGTQGLASVAMGQKAGGMYDSTTNTQLTNDLLSRITTQVASANAGKTTTSSGSVTTKATPSALSQVSSASALTSLGLVGASALASPILKAAAKKTGLTDGAQSVADWITGLGAGASDPVANLVDSSQQMAQQSYQQMFSDQQAAADQQALQEAAATQTPAVGAGADPTAALAPASDTSGVAPIAADTTTVATPAAAESTGATGAGAADAGGTAAADTAGTAAADTAGAAAADAGATTAGADAGGSVLADAAISAIICTEAVKQNLLDNQKYLDEVEVNKTRLTKFHIDGYHIWAIPVVKAMRKNGTVAKVVASWANSYIDHTTYNRRNFAGYVGVFIGEPLSYVLGFVAAKLNKSPDYKKALYA